MRLASFWLVLGLCVVVVWLPTRSFAQAAEYRSLECLALNVYWESRSRSTEGQRAVAHVTINRMADPGFPDTICDVVQQGSEETQYGCQFHWWCDGKHDVPDDASAWQEAVEIARLVMSGDDPDPTDGAIFFHNTAIEPSWVSAHVRTVQIGPHIFYR